MCVHVHVLSMCARRDEYVFDSQYGLSIGLSLPVIYKAINNTELQLLPHTALGVDLLLSNNTAANGPEPDISLPADHTHSRCQASFTSTPPGESPYGLFVCQKVLIAD